MPWSRQRERLLFISRDPAFQRPEWAPGQLIDHEGAIFRVTRWEERRPIRLRRGGSVREWEIWGRRVPDSELREELDEAARRLLSPEG